MTRFNPFARLMARKGRKTRNTRRILMVDTALELFKIKIGIEIIGVFIFM
jgi:hypothetical protein